MLPGDAGTANEPAIGAHVIRDYWRGVASRAATDARKRLNEHTLSVLGAPIGGVLLGLLLAYFYQGFETVESSVTTIACVIGGIVLWTLGYFFVQFVRLPPIIDGEQSERHARALAAIHDDRGRIVEQYARLCDLIQQREDESRGIHVTPAPDSTAAAVRVSTFGAELTVAAEARIIRVVGGWGEKVAPKESYPLTWRETALRDVVLGNNLVGYAVLATSREGRPGTCILDLWKWSDGKADHVAWWPVTEQQRLQMFIEVVITADDRTTSPYKYIVTCSPPYGFIDMKEVGQWDWERQPE